MDRPLDRVARSGRTLLWPLLLMAACVPLRAAEPDELAWSAPLVDPVRASSLPLEQPLSPPNQEGWQVVTTLSYVNVFHGSTPINWFHRFHGRDGDQLESEELRQLESCCGEHGLHFIDVEGWRTDLGFARALPRGLSLAVGLSWMRVGAPRWDALSSEFHALFGIDQNKRDLYPAGRTLVYAWSPNGMVERRGDLRGGLGDTTVSLSGRAGRFAGGEHRWAVALQAPTGDENDLSGSGGWDAGVRWFGDWVLGPGRLQAAAGYTWLDGGGAWLGLPRNNTSHFLVEYLQPVSRRLGVRLAARSDRSPLEGFTGSRLGGRSLVLRGGLRVRLRERSWFAVELGESVVAMAATPDFTLQLQFGSFVR